MIYLEGLFHDKEGRYIFLDGRKFEWDNKILCVRIHMVGNVVFNIL